MKYIFTLAVLIVLLVSQCGSGELHSDLRCSAETTDSIVKSSTSYDVMKKRVAEKQATLKGYFDETIPESRDELLVAAGTQLHHLLIDSIFPYWYGTKWDFNGYTDIPGEGIVACGYFVSTPLKHAGLNLNRYKIAQQYSHSIVNTLCTDIRDINGYDHFSDTLDHLLNGLYIVGLDNHVGFISVEKEGNYFIHSSYIDPVCVVKEPIKTSLALQNSSRYILGNFTGNKKIIKKWLHNQLIEIVP